ncbi:MAG TPA: transglutaminase family protein, partial [Pyrinomonadaceae bacterium]|nr:transglutaminase family protein [Pyrinomonadaceae bacterium]
SDSGKVREIKAWLIRSSGPVKKYGKDNIVDVAEDSNDVYNESRYKLIDGSKDADAGSVFGYQTTTQQKSNFSQDVWKFQDRLPTLVSRYTLALPTAWRAKSVTFNHSAVEPVVSGSTYTWELRDLSPIAPEPNSPHVSSLAPRIAVSYFPPGDTQTIGLRTFATWAEVSRWLSELHDPQAVPDEAMTARVRQLTVDAKTELDRIRAIGRFVHSIKYISIDIGVSRGGGMRPHAATEVFAKSYGDCKDKVNLMRAMLKVLDIVSYPVAIYAGDPTYVREEWASPHQFNHCIIAVKVSDETQTATVINHPKLGRLLIFDATNNTPVGDLPEQEQGSWALIVAGDAGSLMRMPVTPPESNLLDRQIEANLDAGGSLTATIREKATGQFAAGYRGEYRRASRPEYVKHIEGWVTAGATAARVSKVEPRDDIVADRFDLDVDFVAPAYGQLMQGRLLVFKPAIVSRRESIPLTEAKRKHPVVLDAHSFSETVRVKLPAGFDVDETPDPVKLETSFGSYSTNYEVKDGQLVFTRKLVQRAATIPVEQYNSVRSFYERIRAAEQAPVVLARK